MATNVTADHTKAFEEALELAGVAVDIDGDTVSVIVSRDFESEQGFDSDGNLQNITTGSVTALAADLPTLAIDSTVTIEGTVYRITDNNAEGKICRTLELESP